MSLAVCHLHTFYSLFDGLASPEEYCQRANEVGITALADTNHGSLSGHRHFYRACKDAGIKPMLGIETYYTDDRFDRRDRKSRTEPLDLVYNHLVVIAKNDVGLRNLSRMNEIAWTEGYFFKPRIDMELLEEYGEGLIVSSACMSGVVAKAIEHGELNVAKEHASKLKLLFGNDYYIEVMPHNPAKLNHALLELADSLGIKAIVTPDCHHASKDQKVAQEMMLLLGTHTKALPDRSFAESQKIPDMMKRLDYLYGEDRKMSFRSFDIHLLSEDEMRAAMLEQGIDRDDIFSNTMVLADSVGEYDLPDHVDVLPVEYADPDKTLRGYAVKGLKEKGLTDDTYKQRLDYELSVVKSKGFSPYFLMVRNVVSFAHQSGIRMGPGRGSGAGSLLAYALGITQVDPIKHKLLFERFLDAGYAVYDPVFNVL